MNVHGNEYATNDHVALASDLRSLTRSGFRVLPLAELIALWLREPAQLEDRRLVALTCDDGPDLDFHDLPHPVHGIQRSMLNILADFQRELPGAQPRLHITSFVIVSPEARDVLDATCMLGRKWWNDDWWPRAVATGLMDIANHSWNHNHATLGPAAPGDPARGTFTNIDSKRLADDQIKQAHDYLRSRAPNAGASLFAYPYGESNAFLVEEYFPRQSGIVAAFAGQPECLSSGSDRWRLPRFTCGLDWKTPGDLERILERAAA